MSRYSVAWKHFQRRLYSLLSSRRALAFCLIGVIITLNSTFRVAEVLIGWSESSRALSLRPFRDNIAETDLQGRLCSPMPIDVVYTWVNGSDQRMQQQLAFFKALLAPTNSTASPEPSAATDSPTPTEALFVQGRRPLGIEGPEEEALRQMLEEAGLSELADHLIRNSANAEAESEATEAPTVAAPIASTDTPTDAASTTSGGEQADEGPTRRPLATQMPESTAPPTTNGTEDHFSASRFQDNNELRYSLRSIARFAPWVRNIYIVTNGQIPSWLNLDHPRVFVITHEQLFPDASHLPTFSSPAIESHLHRIPGLSDRFIYLNDDVMFGSEVWPEDFYTHARGQKVYLSWPVPNCADGCPSSWIGDSYCDLACNTTACDFDGGDCLGTPNRTSASSRSSYSSSSRASYASRYCVTGCPDSWIGDRYCDRACNVSACGFDAGDCGLASIYSDLAVFNATQTNQLIVTDVRAPAFFINFNGTALDNTTRVSEVAFTRDGGAIRTAIFSDRYNGLSITLNRNVSLSLSYVNLTLSNNGTTVDSFLVRILSDSLSGDNTTAGLSSLPTGIDVDDVVARLVPDTVEWGRGRVTTDPIGAGSGYSSSSSSSSSSSYRSSYYRGESPLVQATRLLATLGNNTYRVEEGLVPLPDDVVEQLQVLFAELSDDELTLKGFNRKSQAALAVFNVTTNATDVGDAPANATESADATESAGARTLLWVPADAAVDDADLAWDAAARKAAELEAARVQPRWAEYRAALEKLTGGLSDAEPDIEWLRRTLTRVPSEIYYSRHLLDTFGDSLKHVNKLFNRRYGAAARKVPAHMPHMIDKRIMAELQAAFPREFEETSRHRLRNSTDMQYSFSYFYFMMQEAEPFDARAFWNQIDVDGSGDLNENELRSLAVRLFPLPLQQASLDTLRGHITNCSLTTASTTFGQDRPDRLSFDLFESCEPLLQLVRDKSKPALRYKHEVMPEKDVFFKMIRNNATIVRNDLDNLRKEPRKFICLNDNIDHDKPGAADVVETLQLYYQSMFPHASEFELPDGVVNEFQYMDERQASVEAARTRSLLTMLGLVAALFLLTSRCLWRATLRLFGRSGDGRSQRIRSNATKLMNID